MADEAKPPVFALADDVVRSAGNGVVNGFGYLLTGFQVDDSMDRIAAAADTAVDKVAMLFGAAPVGKGNFADNLAAEKAATAQAKKESPVGSFIGDATGEVATLFLGGGLIAKGIEWLARGANLLKGAVGLEKIAATASTLTERTNALMRGLEKRVAEIGEGTASPGVAGRHAMARTPGRGTPPRTPRTPPAAEAAPATPRSPVRRPDVTGFSQRQQAAINEAYDSAPSHDIGMQRVVQLKGEIEKAPPPSWYAKFGWPATVAAGSIFAAYEISEKGPKGFASIIPEGSWLDRRLSFSPGYSAIKTEFAAKSTTLPEGTVSSVLTGQPMKRSHEPGSP